MPEERFDIFFSGKLIDGQDPAEARAQVGRLFKAADDKIERLFSGKPVAVKKDVDLETASRYRLAFRKAGALVDIKPSGKQAPLRRKAAASAQAAPAEAGMRLLPANTGSLEDCAPVLKPAPLPDVSAIDLAAPGAVMEESAEPAPANIDTGDLDLVAGMDWSLEDCQPAPLPLVMPDLDGLDLAALDDASHIPPEPPPAPLPDTSALSLKPAAPPSTTATTSKNES
jgi:hypothetical protein